MTPEHKALVERANDTMATIKAGAPNKTSQAALEALCGELIAALSTQSAQPQAGEPVKVWIGELDLQFIREGHFREAKVFNYEDEHRVPLYASPQPANPARVTDAPERIWAGDFDMGLGHCTVGMGGLYEEYVRADIAASQLAEARAGRVTLEERLATAYQAKYRCNEDANFERRLRLAAEAERDRLAADNARLREALEPFAEAWDVAVHHEDLVRHLTLGQLGELAAHEVSGVHFRRARAALTAALVQEGRKNG